MTAGFPGDRNIDAGADVGGDVGLAEVVAGTVKLAAREQADVTSFREDQTRDRRARDPIAGKRGATRPAYPRTARAPLPSGRAPLAVIRSVTGRRGPSCTS